MPAYDRFTHIDISDMATPLHMVCPSCTGYWGKGYLVHLDTCPTPKWVYDSRIDKCEQHHTCVA